MNPAKSLGHPRFQVGDMVRHKELPGLGSGTVTGPATGGGRLNSVEVIWSDGKKVAHLGAALVKTQEPNMLMKSIL